MKLNPLSFMTLLGTAALFVAGACGDDEETTSSSSTSTTASSTTSTSSTGGNGTGGSTTSAGGTGGTGGGGDCVTCADAVMGTPPVGMCPGSQDLFEALIMCMCSTCQTDCIDACQNDMEPDETCIMCLEDMDMGCGAEAMACLSDTGM
jgi:hypothetical protein